MPLSLIPQIFFDLIARITPGMILLLLLPPSFLGPQRAIKLMLSYSEKGSLLNITSLLILIVFSYLLGFILGQLYTIFFGKIAKKSRNERNFKSIKDSIDENNKIRKLYNEEELKYTPEQLPPSYVMHDYLRFFSPSEAYRLLKLRAESRLCEVLLLGFSLLFILNAGMWIIDSNLAMIDRAIFALIMFVSLIILLIRRDTFENFYISGTCRLWLFYSFPFESFKKIIEDRQKLLKE
jgi:hypothetical protein